MKFKYIYIIFLLIFCLFVDTQAFALWVWTPKTNKWINPKTEVKETPSKQLEYALGFMEAQEYKTAIKEFKKLLKRYPQAREAPRAQYYIGLCVKQKGKLFEAFKAFQVVIEKYPFSDLSKEIVQKQYEIGEELLRNKDQKNELIGSIIGTNYNIIEVFKTVIKNSPYGDLAAPSQYKVAAYLDERNIYQEARDEYEKVINDYPEAEWAKKAKYKIAMLDAKRSTTEQYDQKTTKVAVDGLQDFIKAHPKAASKEKAIKEISKLREKEAKNNWLIAEFYEKQKNHKAAKMYYQIIVNEYKDSKLAAQSLKKILDISRKEE